MVRGLCSRIKSTHGFHGHCSQTSRRISETFTSQKFSFQCVQKLLASNPKPSTRYSVRVISALGGWPTVSSVKWTDWDTLVHCLVYDQSQGSFPVGILIEGSTNKFLLGHLSGEALIVLHNINKMPWKHLGRHEQGPHPVFLAAEPGEKVRQCRTRIPAGTPAVDAGSQPVIGDIETYISGARGG